MLAVGTHLLLLKHVHKAQYCLDIRSVGVVDF